MDLMRVSSRSKNIAHSRLPTVPTSPSRHVGPNGVDHRTVGGISSLGAIKDVKPSSSDRGYSRVPVALRLVATCNRLSVSWS